MVATFTMESEYKDAHATIYGAMTEVGLKEFQLCGSVSPTPLNMVSKSAYDLPQSPVNQKDQGIYRSSIIGFVSKKRWYS